MAPTLLDTDVLSALMRRHPEVISSARRYLAEHGRLTISVITMYEIQRGLKAKNATKQLTAFDALCKSSTILPVDDMVADRASTIYSDLASRGELIGDADMLIAATALVYKMGLVTNNHKHFSRIAGLEIERWTE